MSAKPKDIAAQVAALLGDDAVRPSRTPGTITTTEYAAYQHVSGSTANEQLNFLVAQGRMRRFRFRVPHTPGAHIGYELVFDGDGSKGTRL